MTEYMFKYGPFYFSIHGEDDQDAIRKAKQAILETSTPAADVYLNVDLTAGAFEGRIYLDPEEITDKNICQRDILPEVTEDVPF